MKGLLVIFAVEGVARQGGLDLSWVLVASVAALVVMGFRDDLRGCVRRLSELRLGDRLVVVFDKEETPPAAPKRAAKPKRTK